MTACPPGTYAHPQSRRCRRPPSTFARSFYLRMTFRIKTETWEAEVDERVGDVQRATAFLLGVSLSDVKLYRWDGERDLQPTSYEVLVELEVVTPFVGVTDARAISMDHWFAAMSSPLSSVRVVTWDEIHAPKPVNPREPMLSNSMYFFILAWIFAMVSVWLVWTFWIRRNQSRKDVYIVGQPKLKWIEDTIMDVPVEAINRYALKENL